jgi:lipopolysaccharide transport system permease protein
LELELELEKAGMSDDEAAAWSSERWIENRATSGWRGVDLRELWDYREVAAFLALRDLKVRYKQAAFGAAWAVLQPLAGVVVFTIVFQRLAGMPSDGVAYPLFAFAGLALWNYLASAVTKSTQSLVNNSPLVTKVYFPRLLAPVAAVLPGLVDLGVSLPVLAVLLLLYGVTPGLAVLTTPLWIVAAAGVALSVGVWLAALNVRFRDVNHAIALFVQLWLFVSPVAYPLSSVEPAWRTLYAINPAVGIIEGFRWAVLGTPWPGVHAAVSLAAGGVVLLLGIAYFQASERRFADII